MSNLSSLQKKSVALSFIVDDARKYAREVIEKRDLLMVEYSRCDDSVKGNIAEQLYACNKEVARAIADRDALEKQARELDYEILHFGSKD